MLVISKMDNNTEKDPLLSSTSNKIDQTKKTDGAQKQLSSDHRQITRLITVEPVVILVAFCWTSQSPLLEQYGYAKLAAKANVSILPSEEENNCNANESDPIYEIQQKIQSQTSDFVTILMLISSLPNVIVLPVFMFLSDRFGRKPILLFNLSCMLIGYIELLVFVQLDESLEMMYISAATFGLFGTQTLLSTSLAYLADCSDRVDRSFKMIIFEVCTSIASILSNISTGFLIKYVDIIFPFLSFVVCTSVALLYTLFLLPESLRKTHHVKQERSWVNFIAPYKASIAVFFKDNGTNRRWKIQLTAAVNAVVTGNHVGLLILLPLYLLNSPICFDSLSIAIVIVEIYFFRTIGSLIIPKVFKSLLSDTSLIIVSLISDMIFLAIIGFLPYAVWIFFAPIPGMAGLLTVAVSKGFASKLLSPGEQGAYFAGNQILATCASVVATFINSAIYKATLNFYHGTIFIAQALLTLIMLFLILILHLAVRKETRNVETKKDSPNLTSSHDSFHLSTEIST